MRWFMYEIGPIDFCWPHMKTVDETAKELGAISASAAASGFAGQEEVPIGEFLSDWEAAKTLYSSPDELRNPPAVFWVPYEDRFAYGFVIKLANNGTTYVVSPVELPHLGDTIPD